MTHCYFKDDVHRLLSHALFEKKLHRFHLANIFICILRLNDHCHVYFMQNIVVIEGNNMCTASILNDHVHLFFTIF